jgi:hypothetical protein
MVREVKAGRSLVFGLGFSVLGLKDEDQRPKTEDRFSEAAMAL